MLSPVLFQFVPPFCLWPEADFLLTPSKVSVVFVQIYVLIWCFLKNQKTKQAIYNNTLAQDISHDLNRFNVKPEYELTLLSWRQ